MIRILEVIFQIKNYIQVGIAFEATEAGWIHRFEFHNGLGLDDLLVVTIIIVIVDLHGLEFNCFQRDFLERSNHWLLTFSSTSASIFDGLLI